MESSLIAQVFMAGFSLGLMILLPVVFGLLAIRILFKHIN
jgi:hypothetical protein